jgi:pimeloyl-ACP methyl ester carboxylesterase
MKKVSFFILTLLFAVNALAQTEPGVAIDPSLTESPVLLRTLSGSVSGSLVMPKNVPGKIPVVLIVADAGYTDRDGNNLKTGVAANTYKLLANGLGKNGIATLRYDKRLVGQSVGSTKESQLHMEDYSDDAVDLIKLLNVDERFSKIIVFGHGEGSLVGLIASYEQPVKGLILAEGAADKGDKILADEMKLRPKFLADEFQVIMDSLRKGKTTDKVDPSLYFIARPAVQPFIMSWCRYDPIRIIKADKIPVLIIQGTTDLIVPVNNGERLKKAKSDAVLLTIKGMNHVLKEAPADEEKNAETYSKPDLPLKPELVAGIVDFINKLK